MTRKVDVRAVYLKGGSAFAAEYDGRNLSVAPRADRGRYAKRELDFARRFCVEFPGYRLTRSAAAEVAYVGDERSVGFARFRELVATEFDDHGCVRGRALAVV